MVMSSSNMNAAVHTSARVHRCREDVLGTSAIVFSYNSARGAATLPPNPEPMISTS